MNKVPPNILELPLAERGLAALKIAVAKAIAEHARHEEPIYVWRDDRVVEVFPDEVRTKVGLIQES